jgi:D-alanyl-D-alanine carboxypeptidase/D-alanyl-D-alanine-endopeptidase (penicillin-binding protein 4)
MSVSIGDQGRFLYRNGEGVPRIPASNEKLLLSMALLDALGPEATILTRVRAEAAPAAGVVDGALWIVGRGDPEVGRGTIAELARRIVAAGITRIRGRVMGSTAYFRRERWALGWRAHYTRNEVPFPTALAFRGNVGPSGGHIGDPERRAAAALTHRLRQVGVRVSGRPGMGRPRDPLTTVATTRSRRLKVLLREMDVDSLNFYADELEKVLGASVEGAPATFEEGGRAIESFERGQGVDGFEHHDGSGLSYADRVTTGGIVRLLWAADGATWGSELRGALAHAGQGTLINRLKGVRVRAKTGTLAAISALSGWVWLEKEGTWGTFSILSRGLSKTDAIRIEDAIVRTVSRNAP